MSRSRFRALVVLLLVAPLTAGSVVVARAAEISLTVVNVVSPQDVKIWEPTSVAAKKGDRITLRLVNKHADEHGYEIAAFGVKEVALGERVYRENCAVCHGVRGDGQGMAAHHFLHKPRDLTKGRFKFRSTASGQVPTDADLRRSIVQGVPSTAMVPQDHLSAVDVDG